MIVSHLPKAGGVYRILNLSTHDSYIGKSICVRDRLIQHRSELRHGKHRNRALQNHWNLLGAEAFEVSMLELESDPVLLYVSESRYVNELAPSYNRQEVPDADVMRVRRLLADATDSSLPIRRDDYLWALDRLRDRFDRGPKDAKYYAAPLFRGK